jgi:lysine 2,3-aminomutase
MQKKVSSRVPVVKQSVGGLPEAAGDSDEEPPGSSATCVAPKSSFFVRKSQAALSGQTKATVISFPDSKSPKTFRNRFFPDASLKDWNDWQWQVQHRIRRLDQLESMLKLSVEERAGFEMSRSKLPVGITPYFMSLLSADDPLDPLRRTVVPTVSEFIKMPEESDDPLAEESQSPLPGLVHRYPDRTLLLVLDFCSTYCRYCTRSRIVGHSAVHPSRARLQQAIDYIGNTPSVRDVLISGGDPLTLNDDRLEWLICRLRKIPHVEIIRIGTKVPAVLPQRITRNLTRMLRKYHPIWMSLHFTHPGECTPDSYRACERLADAGIPLGSQTVLLKGINDSVETMKTLVHHLLRMRVRPYYLYQCDPIPGSNQFRTPVEKGLEIIQGLRGFTSGYAVPTYVIDAPGGGGKIPLMPNYVKEWRQNSVVLRNYENKLYGYPDASSR